MQKRVQSPLMALDKLSNPSMGAQAISSGATSAKRECWRYRWLLAGLAALAFMVWQNTARLDSATAQENLAREAAIQAARNIEQVADSVREKTLRAAQPRDEFSTSDNEYEETQIKEASQDSVVESEFIDPDALEDSEDNKEDLSAGVVDTTSSQDPVMIDSMNSMAPPSSAASMTSAGNNALAKTASSSSAIKVCAVATNPRQGSIFRTNLMSELGSGKYIYEVKKHGQCSTTAPRVRMIPYVKCCTDMALVQRLIASSFKTYDIVIVTGDEYCAVRSTQFHYRQYFGDNVIGSGMVSKLRGIKLPLYFPLGPRSEFERVDQVSGVPPANSRKYAINFVGSPTSIPRRRLRDYFQSEAWTSNPLSSSSFIHVTDSWTQRVDETKGYISPEQYREVILDSKFTLCPMGHNPEAYRIYEACEAGSVPVLVTKEEDYVNHKCSNAFKPLLDSGAPFVVLDDWNQLPELLEMIHTNKTFSEEKQRATRAWYAEYMSKFAHDFEEMMEFRYKLRTGRSLA